MLGLSCFGTNSIEKKVSAMNRLLSVRELLVIAGRTSSRALPVETATSLPMATMSEGRLQVVVLYYKEISRPGKERKTYPPHHIMTLDPTTGEVIKFTECTPKDFGLDQRSNEPEIGYGLDPKMSGAEFQSFKRRFQEISPAVWELFGSGRATLDMNAKVLTKEYHTIFLKIAKKPLIPYYKAVATDFFNWLDKVTK